ncbi:hypothetical protein HDU76_011363, partial [Blyttiomyces sp. JEL0837]
MLRVEELENVNKGATWGNLFGRDGNDVGWVCLMVLCSAVLWFVLGYYLDNIIPQSSGIPRPWTFPITSIRKYFGFKEPSQSEKYLGLKKADSQQEQQSSSIDDTTDPDQYQSSDIEQDPPNMTRLIKLQNITKRFDSGWTLCGRKGAKITAVDNVSLNFYQGEIFALLGHNGAGKSTLFSMLTGVLGMSSGVGKIAGFDIEKDMNSIRQVIGVCPQFDVLYDDLTVLEHLYLFSGLKGFWKTNTPQSLYNLLTTASTQMNLQEKLNERVKNLSGGMKRKLSVAVAMIGDPVVLILDEPCSGMDAVSRREFWKVVGDSGKKKGRLTLFATHIMD